MPSFDKKAEQQHGQELKQQLKEQFDLNKDGKLKGDERTAFKEALQARTAREAGVEHTHEKTKDGYQKSTYQRPDKDLTADEKNHGYAPSYSEKRFTGRDTGGLAPKAEADIKFRFNRSDLTPEAERAVTDVATEINRIRRENNGTIPAGTKITVHGHTDSIGDASYNQTLSEQRAKAAKDAIVKATGIDPELINVVGHGEKDPVTSNNTREGRAQNRRVEIDVTAPVKEKEAPKPAPPAPADTKVEVKPAAPAPELKKEEPKPAPPAPADTKVEVKPAAPAPEQRKEEPKPAPQAPADTKVEVKPAAPAPEQKKEEPKPAPAAPADKKVEVKPAPATEQKKEEPKPAPAAPADKKVEVKPASAPAPDAKKQKEQEAEELLEEAYDRYVVARQKMLAARADRETEDS
jgi:outer membrane protein OmpA-like peptidoglycan-associated protein